MWFYYILGIIKNGGIYYDGLLISVESSKKKYWDLSSFVHDSFSQCLTDQNYI